MKPSIAFAEDCLAFTDLDRVQHVELLNEIAGHVEVRDAEHAARLATLVGGLRETLRPYATGCAFAVRAYLARLDAESSGPAIPDGTVR